MSQNPFSDSTHSEGNPPDDLNPYAAPTGLSEMPYRGTVADSRLKLPMDFRRQVHALCGAWLFLGVLGYLIGEEYWSPFDFSMLTLIGMASYFMAIGFFVCGIGAIFKNQVALRVGLGLCYTIASIFVLGYYPLLLANGWGDQGTHLSSPIVFLLALGLIPFSILTFVIFQSHRVLRMAKQLQQAGIPLTATPANIVEHE